MLNTVATHQLHVLPYVDHIYFLEDGHIAEQGSYAQLLANDGHFAKLIEEYGNSDEADTKDENETDQGEKKEGEEKTAEKASPLMQEEVCTSFVVFSIPECWLMSGFVVGTYRGCCRFVGFC